MKSKIYILMKTITLLSVLFALIACKKEDNQSNEGEISKKETPITETVAKQEPTPFSLTTDISNEKPTIEPIVTEALKTTIVPTPSPTPFPTDSISSEGVQVVIYKTNRKLELYQDGNLIGEYNIGLGFNPEGHKEVEGDGKTPEGTYYVCTKNAQSKFYLSLGLSYPSIPDAIRGLEDSIISQEEHDSIINAINSKQMPSWNTRLGGEIMIHGHGSHSDWTLGCIAVDNEVMDILWVYCQNGTNVTIYP